MSKLTTMKAGLARVDGLQKVRGQARYTGDIVLPRMAYVAFAGAKIASGRVRSIDTTRAEAARGVIAVYTHENTPRLPQPGGMREPIVALQGTRIHYADQFIAAVVAETPAAAEAGAALIEATYAEEAPVATFEAGLANAFEPEAWNAFRTPISLRGDPDAAYEESPQKIDLTVETAMRQHNPLEANTTVAQWRGDKLMIWNADQYIYETKEIAARAFEIPEEDVTVKVDFVGGGYGCKVGPWPHTMLTAQIAKLAGRPVKMVLSRRQMYSSAGHMPATRQHVRMGFESDGRLRAIIHESTSQGPTHDPQYCEWGAMPARYLYDCENVRTQHYVSPMHNGAPTTMRAPHEGAGIFGLDTALDMLAHRLEIDPVALRLRNIPPRDQHFDLPWSTNAQADVYRQGAEAFGWSARNPKPGARRENGELIGMGMASALRPNSKTTAHARVSINGDGEVIVASATSEIGTGTATALTIVAAEALGVSPDQVTVRIGDTSFPRAPYVAGSVTMNSVGSAVLIGARALKARLAQAAVAHEGAPLYGADPETLIAQDGALVDPADPRRRESLAAMARRAEGGGVSEVGTFEPAAATSSSRSLGAQFVEVRVDPLLGRIRVSRMLGAFAVGRVVSPKTARSQATGGMIWGVGEALMEKTELDPATARPVNASFLDNYVPVQGDVPEIDVLFVDDIDTDPNPLGSKSIGEVVSTGVAPAIANALYNATGVRVTSLPIRTETLLAQL
ncbi:MAG: xanthine dehydrogenase family protein molybdopterin-binding subunit [Pseudomonadota bacterium]